MKRLIPLAVSAALSSFAAAQGTVPPSAEAGEKTPVVYTTPVRNPFWPIGYHGSFSAISDGSEEARLGVMADSAAVRRAEIEAANVGKDDPIAHAREVSRRWRLARKSLNVGGVTRAAFDGGTVRRVLMVNSRTYGEGDTLVVEQDGWQMAWKVVSFTSSGEVSLQRLGATKLPVKAADEEDPIFGEEEN